MPKTLIVLNPHAANGRAGALWTEIEPLLWQKLGELVVAVTQRPDEVARHLDKAYAAGIRRVISIGGDGTNHALVNALAELGERIPGDDAVIYGTLPIGSGRDWARGAGIPIANVRAAADWIASAAPKPVDLGLLQSDSQREYFLNIASVGMSGEVAARVNRAVKRPWTFLQATVETLLRYKPKPVTIELDGARWYDDRAYLVVIANGTTFGHGMKIAPEAQVDDGLFDVLVIEAVSRFTILKALQRVYKGTHLTHPAVRFARAAQVRIESTGGLLGLELDGEVAHGEVVQASVRPGMLSVLRG